MTPEEIIKTLNLEPHPEEGGWFREIYRTGEEVAKSSFQKGHGVPRVAGTAIYYLLTPDTYSAMHRLKSDEIFHFYWGDPVEQLLLLPDGSHEIRTLGTGLNTGLNKNCRPVSIVPAGVWQGARLKAGGAFALMGCTVSPGFEYEDYEHGNRETLIAGFPDVAGLVETLSS